MALVSISKHITHQNGYSTNKRGICGICVCVCIYIYIYFKRSYIQHAMMTHLMPLILYASPKISTKTISQLGNSIWADVKSKRGVQYGGKRVVGWMRCSCQMSTLLVSSSLFFFQQSSWHVLWHCGFPAIDKWISHEKQGDFPFRGMVPMF